MFLPLHYRDGPLRSAEVAAEVLKKTLAWETFEQVCVCVCVSAIQVCVCVCVSAIQARVCVCVCVCGSVTKESMLLSTERANHGLTNISACTPPRHTAPPSAVRVGAGGHGAICAQGRFGAQCSGDVSAGASATSGPPRGLGVSRILREIGSGTATLAMEHVRAPITVCKQRREVLMLRSYASTTVRRSMACSLVDVATCHGDIVIHCVWP